MHLVGNGDYDDCFDARFSANLRCESFIKSAYRQCVSDSLLFYDIITKVKELDGSISGTCILTGLLSCSTNFIHS